MFFVKVFSLKNVKINKLSLYLLHIFCPRVRDERKQVHLIKNEPFAIVPNLGRPPPARRNP